MAFRVDVGATRQPSRAFASHRTRGNPWKMASTQALPLGAVFVAVLAAQGCSERPPAAPPCVPACRAGFTCANGACVQLCTPPCNANERCVTEGAVPTCEIGGGPIDAGSMPQPTDASADIGAPFGDASNIDAFSTTDVLDESIADVVDVLDEAALCRIRCGPKASCEGTTCRCVGNLPMCGGICRDLASDITNCGACGRRCTWGVCSSGVCGGRLNDGGDVCDGIRVDLSRDTRNCGACGNACPVGRACVSMQCVDASCPSNRREDSANCGSCNNRCPAGQICDLGRCVTPSCLYCNGPSCVNPNTDRNNCGRCGVICTTPRGCVDGVCR